MRAGAPPPARPGPHPTTPHGAADAPAIHPPHQPWGGGQPAGRGPGTNLAGHPPPASPGPRGRAGGRLRRRRQGAQSGPLRPHRWQVNGSDRHEVLVGAEGLQRGPTDVLGTLLHEAAHGLAQARGIADTSRQGRYHNRRYATLAHELGLEVTSVPPIGWSATTVPEPTAGLYAGQLEELAAALVLWRRLEAPATAGTRSRNLLACSCPCGRKLRAARTTLAEAPILCGACAQPFQPEEQEN
jgi:hypothetical protein